MSKEVKGLHKPENYDEAELEVFTKRLQSAANNYNRLQDEKYLISAAYDANFDQIARCEKKTEKHRALLYVENMLNERGKVVSDKLPVAKNLISVYERYVKAIEIEIEKRETKEKQK